MENVKTAVLLFGQARYPDYIEEHESSTYNRIVRANQLEQHVYCCFWDEPNAHRALELYKPKTHLLINPNVFPKVKRKFWDDWTKNIGYRHWNNRKRLFKGDVPNLKYPGTYVCRDNMLRWWHTLTNGLSIVSEGYDLIVATRNDLSYTQFRLMDPGPEKLMVRSLSYGTDHMLLARVPEMKAITSIHLAKEMAKDDDIALFKGSQWLTGESTARYLAYRQNYELVIQATGSVPIRKEPYIRGGSATPGIDVGIK